MHARKAVGRSGLADASAVTLSPPFASSGGDRLPERHGRHRLTPAERGGVSESRLGDFARRCIYSRWFYGFLALVCLLDAVTDLIDLIRPGEDRVLDVISLAGSSVAAILAAIVFADLLIRRTRL